MARVPLTIADAGHRFRSGDLSPSQLLEHYLGVIDSTDGELSAFITVCRDAAMTAAKAAELMISSGYDLDPLHGVPIALKDNISIAGVRTRSGSKIHSSHVPTEDATVVKALKRAGAIIVGKTNLHEFASGATTVNPHYGTTRNPWDLARSAAGSSGGSGAAVSGGECLCAIGTDTGGSIRLPAAVTGIAGLRPTIGRVSNAGVFPLAWTLDTVGPMARSVADLGLLLQCIAGYDPLDPATSDRGVPSYRVLDSSTNLNGVRIGLVRDYSLEGLTLGLRDVFHAALKDLEALGARVIEIPQPEGFEEQFAAWYTVRIVETTALHENWIRERADDYGKDVRALINAGHFVLGTEYVQAQRFRQLLRSAFSQEFERIDVIATPTAAGIAMPVEQPTVGLNGAQMPLTTLLSRFTGLPTCLGFPAISIPCGFVNGMPVGMQLMAAPFEERRLIEIGASYECVNAWHLVVPPIHRKREEKLSGDSDDSLVSEAARVS